MYNKKALEIKKPAMLALIMVFLFSFVFAIFLNSAVSASAISDTKAGNLFTGTNISVTVGADGTGVSNKNNTKSMSDFNYAAVLPFVYERNVTNGYDDDTKIISSVPQFDEIGVLGTQYFDLKFMVSLLGSNLMTFEFADYQNEKNRVKVVFDFSEFNAEPEEENYEFSVTVSTTIDNWKTTTGESTTPIIDWGTYFDADSDTDPTAALQNIVFELAYSSSGLELSWAEQEPIEDGLQYNPISYATLWGSNFSFVNDTAKMSIKYEDHRNEAEHSVIFKSINGQSLASDTSTDGAAKELPVINKDRKVDPAKYTASVNDPVYAGLKAGLKTTVNFPVFIGDVINSSIYCFVEIWKIDPDDISIKTKVETKYIAFGSSGISYYFAEAGFFEVRIYAGNLDNTTEVEDAAKSVQGDNSDGEGYNKNFGRVVSMTLTYQIIKDTAAPRLKTIAEDGVDGEAELIKLINETNFSNIWQNLPEYNENFTFPRPDGLFTNDIDEDYCFTFSIGYKFETDSTFQWKDSLSYSIDRTGMYIFKYAVKSPSGKTNRDTYFFDEDYPEFEIWFKDVNAPKIELNSTTQSKKLGDYFTVPSPTIRENSNSGGYVITKETKVFHGYAGWKTQYGLKNNESVPLDEVVFDDDGNFELKSIGTYYFVVFYRTEDYNNMRSPEFSNDFFTDEIPEEVKGYFKLITVTVEKSEEDTTNTVLLIILITLGGLSFLGIIALLFIKPIDETKWRARRNRVK